MWKSSKKTVSNLMSHIPHIDLPSAIPIPLSLYSSWHTSIPGPTQNPNLKPRTQDHQQQPQSLTQLATYLHVIPIALPAKNSSFYQTDLGNRGGQSDTPLPSASQNLKISQHFCHHRESQQWHNPYTYSSPRFHYAPSAVHPSSMKPCARPSNNILRTLNGCCRNIMLMMTPPRITLRSTMSWPLSHNDGSRCHSTQLGHMTPSKRKSWHG